MELSTALQDYIFNVAGLTWPKTAGTGIKVDHAAPVFGWKDLTGQIIPRASGAPSPAFTAFRGTVCKSHAFDAGDIIDQIVFHWPHDYVPNTDVYIHIHWGHNGTAISGAFSGNYYVQYAKGYNQAGELFNSELTIPWALSGINLTNSPQWSHGIVEQLLTSAGGSSTTLDKGKLETDGLIIVGLRVNTVPSISGSVASNLPYIFCVDLHYQSTQMATKNRNFPFFT